MTNPKTPDTGIVKSQDSQQSVPRDSAGIEASPVPDYRYDLIKHVRTIHFTLIATCFVLLAASFLPKQSDWDRALEQARAVQQLIDFAPKDILSDKPTSGDIAFGSKEPQENNKSEVCYVRTAFLNTLEKDFELKYVLPEIMLKEIKKAIEKYVSKPFNIDFEKFKKPVTRKLKFSYDKNLDFIINQCNWFRFMFSDKSNIHIT